MQSFEVFARAAVLGVEEKVRLANGRYRTAINLDNAATTPPFRAVMQEVCRFAPWYSSVHRGTGYKSVLSSNLYEKSRETIISFVNADSRRDVVIFTKNTTEALNLMAFKIAQSSRPEQVVLTTEMEHLANLLPWQRSCRCELLQVDSRGRLLLEDLENKLVKYKGNVRLVAVTGASNVTGYINPVYKVARLAHAYGAEILVDGAQWTPHCPVDMKAHDAPEHIDYLAFSAHKLYAPFGIGVLIGRRELFELGEPFCAGGGTVDLVTKELIDWTDSPQRDEAGSPNVIGVAALTAAIEVLNGMQMHTVYQHEKALIENAIKGLKMLPGIRLYGETGGLEPRVSLISFAVEGIHHRTVAEVLSAEAGIAVRSGLFCAHPYVQKLLNLTQEELNYCHEHLDEPLPGLVRISFGVYNNQQEVDALLDALHWLICRAKRPGTSLTMPEQQLKRLRKETP